MAQGSIADQFLGRGCSTIRATQPRCPLHAAAEHRRSKAGGRQRCPTPIRLAWHLPTRARVLGKLGPRVPTRPKATRRALGEPCPIGVPLLDRCGSRRLPAVHLHRRSPAGKTAPSSVLFWRPRLLVAPPDEDQGECPRHLRGRTACPAIHSPHETMWKQHHHQNSPRFLGPAIPTTTQRMDLQNFGRQDCRRSLPHATRGALGRRSTPRAPRPECPKHSAQRPIRRPRSRRASRSATARLRRARWDHAAKVTSAPSVIDPGDAPMWERNGVAASVPRRNQRRPTTSEHHGRDGKQMNLQVGPVGPTDRPSLQLLGFRTLSHRIHPSLPEQPQ